MRTNISCILCTVFIILSQILTISKAKQDASASRDKKIVLTARTYSNMFARRREEHKLFISHLLTKEYEKKYKMLKLAFQKFLQIMKDINITLMQSGYSATAGFPKDENLQESVILLLENICLSGDILLHLPDMSYRILKGFPEWRETFNWAISFANEFPEIIDENTGKMLEIFRIEINESERPIGYKNPYLTTQNLTEPKKEKKKKKRLKNGPKLTGRNEL